MFPTLKLTARPDDSVRVTTPPSAPKGYWISPSGAIRRDKARRVKLNPDSHHNATRRRARKLFRKGAAVRVQDEGTQREDRDRRGYIQLVQGQHHQA